MLLKTNEKIQLIKMLEKKRRRHYLMFGVFLGLSSGCAIAYCFLKHTNVNSRTHLQKEKDFYCSKFGDIKDAICDMKDHLKKNPCCIDVDAIEDNLK